MEDTENQGAAASEQTPAPEAVVEPAAAPAVTEPAPAAAPAPATQEAPAAPTPPADEKPAVVEPVQAPAPVVAPVAEKPPVVEDTATLAPAAKTASVATAASTVLSDADNDQIVSLKLQLAAFAKAINRPGTEPAQFAPAAKLALQITRFVIQYPKVAILDTMLAFFEENAKGVCAPKNVMKGSTTLGRADEQKVGFLFNLFIALATKSLVRVNNAQVISVLGKPEISNYYDRKISVVRQALNQA